VKAHIGPTIKAHLLRSAFYLLLLLAVCVIPLALAQRTTWGAPANIITVTNLNDNGAGTACKAKPSAPSASTSVFCPTHWPFHASAANPLADLGSTRR